MPPFIKKDDIKKQYRVLAKKYHPDICKDKSKFIEIQKAYELLMEYIENFRYSFDDDEIAKQMPNFKHNSKFQV